MPLFFRTALMLVLTYAAMGCAGRSVGPNQLETTYSAPLGTVTIAAVDQEVSRIFTIYGFTTERRELQGDRLYLQTLWRDRDALEDEREAGAQAARTRLILTSRPRAVTNRDLTPLHAVTLRSEHEYLTTAGTWEPLIVTPDTKLYIDEVADAFRREFTVNGFN
jgi:hypothetical protein